LFEQLCQDATRPGSNHDFGRNIIPAILDDHRVFAFPFLDENRKRQAYWRDVGTLDAYFEANMDLVAVDPQLNVYDERWPIRTYHPNFPPPKFVFAQDAPDGRCGIALDSIVCQGTILSGGQVRRSVLGPNVRVNSFAHVDDSILFEGVEIGRHARVRRAIIDKGVKIPRDAEIGFNHAHDRANGFTVSEGGVVVIAKADVGDGMLGGMLLAADGSRISSASRIDDGEDRPAAAFGRSLSQLARANADLVGRFPRD
jgi:glucose-1-phosphate adenylyltransferase